MLPVSWRQNLPAWIFDGFDWCEAAWLQLGVADVFEGSLCQWIDSVVTWVASYWLISLLIVWLQPWGSLILPQDNSSSIYTKQVKIRILPGLSCTVIPLLCPKVVSPFLLFAAALLDIALNIGHIPIKPRCTTKFNAIIHNMPEIAVLTVPVPLNQRSDEREV